MIVVIGQWIHGQKVNTMRFIPMTLGKIGVMIGLLTTKANLRIVGMTGRPSPRIMCWPPCWHKASIYPAIGRCMETRQRWTSWSPTNCLLSLSRWSPTGASVARASLNTAKNIILNCVFASQWITSRRTGGGLYWESVKSFCQPMKAQAKIDYFCNKTNFHRLRKNG